MQTVEMKPIWDDRGFSHYVGLFKWRTTYGKWRYFKCIQFIRTASKVYEPIWLDKTKPNLTSDLKPYHTKIVYNSQDRFFAIHNSTVSTQWTRGTKFSCWSRFSSVELGFSSSKLASFSLLALQICNDRFFHIFGLMS